MPAGLPGSSTVPSSPPVRWRRLERTRRIYVTAAVLVFNTMLAYVGLNLTLGLLFAVRDYSRKGSNPVSLTYGSRLDQVYPDLPEPQRTEMLSEVWNRPYTYADYIHFQERPFTGKYVTVSVAGYRQSAAQGPWPISSANLNVFCFGGSTLFGYGVADSQTVASYLQQGLQTKTTRRVCVYNFGVGWHYSTQERIRFEQLLAQKIVPDVALFLDGINDSTQACVDRPAFSPQMATAFDQVQAFGIQRPSRGTPSKSSVLIDAIFTRQPIGRLARRLAPTRQSSALEITIITPDQAARSSAVYRWNRTLISAAARAKRVTEIFVVQPSPGYKLDRNKHPLWDLDSNAKEEHFYVTLKKDLDRHPPGEHLLWTADLCETTDGPLYVDACHYTPHFAQAIANDIVEKSLAAGLLSRHLKPETSTKAAVHESAN